MAETGWERKRDDVLKNRFIDALVTRGPCRRPLRNITRAKCWADVTHSARTNLDGLRNARHWFYTRIPGNASEATFKADRQGNDIAEFYYCKPSRRYLTDETGILRSRLWLLKWVISRASELLCDSDNAQRNSARICRQRFSWDLIAARSYVFKIIFVLDSAHRNNNTYTFERIYFALQSWSREMLQGLSDRKEYSSLFFFITCLW